ncbi:MAG TPA: polysaccharide deacetylase family protein [Sporichthyaceae bacterium]|nr:polysaccharide deacetylase family protein [Sporichthyaceae bacterium]
MDGRRALAVLGLTSLVGSLALAVGPPPARPAVGYSPAAGVTSATIAVPVATQSPAPEIEQGAAVSLAHRSDAPAPLPDTPNCLVVRCVALTFDDGPIADTGRLLGILASAGVKATFFDVGEMAAQSPDAVRAELAAGHEVGNHSWSHPQLTRLSDGQVGDQVDRTAQELASIDGLHPMLFRPPYGAVNDRVCAVLAAQGDPVILWSVDTLDWLHRNADSVYRRAVDGVRPGSIVLMHDIHPTTVDAVPRIIAELTRRGYTFVTVSELYGGNLEPGAIYTGREQEWDQQHRRAAEESAPVRTDTGPTDSAQTDSRQTDSQQAATTAPVPQPAPARTGLEQTDPQLSDTDAPPAASTP